MTDDELHRLAYGENYEKITKLRKESVQCLKENFKKKHPYADLSRFEFFVHIDDNLKVTQGYVDFKISEGNHIGVDTKAFLNNKEYTKYLTMEKPKDTESAKKEFNKKYPDADTRKFEFSEVDNKVITYYKIGNGGLLYITYDTFLRTPGFTKYLTNFKERGFGIWFANGTVQPYERNTTMRDIDKFKMYVTDTQYFEASLTPFPITNTSSIDYKKNPYLIAVIVTSVTCIPLFVNVLSIIHTYS